MSTPSKIQKLDETVVNRIAAGEVIQRPANALKELIENSLDAKANNITITVKDGGLKVLQISDNGTGIRKEDMDIVCERFTTSKLQKFDDLKSIDTFGFRGEALASISHVAHLTITTKTANEMCAYKASYIDGKLKAVPKPCAGSQGTTILIENLFYNVATRRKALKSPNEELARITEVVNNYAIHNASVGFILKKHGETMPQVRTPYNSTKTDNIKTIFGSSVAHELIEVEHTDDAYQFKMHALVTNANYSSKRLTLLLFINHRLVDSTPIKKMLDELYSIYLPKKTHPWCYISLEINPANIDVNVHPTKHEVRFLHEDAIVERVKVTIDGQLIGNNASRTFYAKARLPQVDIAPEALREVLPEPGTNKKQNTYSYQLVRTDSADQKLEKFNFTVSSASNRTLDDSTTDGRNDHLSSIENESLPKTSAIDNENCGSNASFSDMLALPIVADKHEGEFDVRNSEISNNSMGSKIVGCSTVSREGSDDFVKDIYEDTRQPAPSEILSLESRSRIGSLEKREARNTFVGTPNEDFEPNTPNNSASNHSTTKSPSKTVDFRQVNSSDNDKVKISSTKDTDCSNTGTINEDVTASSATMSQNDMLNIESPGTKFTSYSVNATRRRVKLTSILTLRKEIESNYHEGLRDIIANMIFVGCVDETFALIQSGVNLYLCNTQKLVEELFYEIMLYDFMNYGVIEFSEPLPLKGLAKLGLETESAGWTPDDGPKEELAASVYEKLFEKADMLNEYFSIIITKGMLKSLPILIENYFPSKADMPLYILRLATEVDWESEEPCLAGICRETARYYSQLSSTDETQDWKYVTEHILYPALKTSLLPPKYFAHDSTILQIARLPELYKVFERC